ncbi:MAG: hypothetical protein HQK54_15790, partial [Oligoflexales bacterium]|nr:hypothetical protein [Oligoflexales bacterium]
VNNRMAELIGAAKEQVLSQNYLKLESWKKSGLLDAANRAGSENRKTYHLLKIKSSFGKDVMLDCYFSRVIIDNSIFLMLTANDATMRLELEAENREMEAQLIQADKLATMGELSAGITHELKRYLNSIKILSQSSRMDIIKERSKKEELEKNLADIVRQVNKMNEIMDHMRIFSRKTVGDTRQKMDINNIIENTCSYFTNELEFDGITLLRQLSLNLPPINLEPNHIEQVLLNLIMNAKHALLNTERTDKKICIASRSVEEDGSPFGKKSLLIEVEDNGTGIPSHLENKIFESFFTTKTPEVGTGLGLSISKKIINGYGGEIVLENRIGEGVKFKIFLPIENDRKLP